MYLHLFALANTILLHYAFSSLKKLLARFVSLLLFWQKKYEMPLYAYHFSVVLHSWDHSFRNTSDKHVLVSYTTTRIVLLVHIHVCHRTLSKNQGCSVFHCSIRVLSTLFAPYFWFLLCSAPSEVSTVFFFHGTAPPSKFSLSLETTLRTKMRKPRTDIGKHRYSVLDNGGHLVREKRRFYRTCQISVWFDRRTDILREVCSTWLAFFGLIQKTIWPSWPLIGWDIFWLFLWNHWTEFSETWKEARS